MKVSYPCYEARVDDYGEYYFFTDYPELVEGILQTEEVSFFESLVTFGDNHIEFEVNDGSCPGFYLKLAITEF